MELSKAVTDIRTNWAIADAKRDEGLTTPDSILRFDNISYGMYGAENLLDIYRRKDAEGLQPTIVNIHGGGFVYGSKEIYQFYCMSLAERGFAVVNINYRLAPENRFPKAVEDFNRVMTFIAENGARYGLDKDRLILVGDSAGAYHVSHYAAILTDESFAKLFDFRIPQVTVRALGLNCGCYDGKMMAGSGSDELFSEYLGTVGEMPSPELLAKVDTLSHITEKYPPCFVMSSYCDFLLPAAKPMADFLRANGVTAELKIYGSPDRPEIAHVFHVNCRLEEAKVCNDDECGFFHRLVK